MNVITHRPDRQIKDRQLDPCNEPHAHRLSRANLTCSPFHYNFSVLRAYTYSRIIACFPFHYNFSVLRSNSVPSRRLLSLTNVMFPFPLQLPRVSPVPSRTPTISNKEHMISFPLQLLRVKSNLSPYPSCTPTISSKSYMFPSPLQLLRVKNKCNPFTHSYYN